MYHSTQNRSFWRRSS